jgi:hypothetical protein
MEFIQEGDDFYPWEIDVTTISASSCFAPKKSQKEVDYMFTCLMAEAIRHVDKFRLTRKGSDFVPIHYPSQAEQIGEFCNALRRYSKDKYDAFFYKWGLANTQVWQDVAVPAQSYWSFCGGGVGTQEYKMPATHADSLCIAARRMVESDKTSEEEFREINLSLSHLLIDTNSLEMMVQKAKNLNMEANTVLERLYLIAKDLGE